MQNVVAVKPMLPSLIGRIGANRKFLVACLGTMFVAALFLYYNTLLPASHEYTVRITNEGFSPDELRIRLGDTVRFINDRTVPSWPASDAHPIHDRYPEFDVKSSIPPGGSWEFRFLQPGKWGVHDHLYSFHRGMIEVN